ncbi:MAG: hypothetical protein F4Y57_14870, partial [Acidobacteria bacterium]|nr:hypothetical protein [Acidobacteriota bacterium]
MLRTLAACIAGVVVSAVPLQAQPAAVEAGGTAQVRAVLDRYCVTCHNGQLRTAGLALDALDVEHVTGHAETWEKVVRKLRARAMPPAGRPRPDEPTYA